MATVRIAHADAVKGVRVPTGERVTVMVRPDPRDVILRLDLDPAERAHASDTFRLFSADGAYDQRRTVRNDVTPGDGFLDLLFKGLTPRTTYSLEIDPGGGAEPQLAFENVPFEELAKLSDKPRPPAVEHPTELRVRLAIDPSEAASADDRFRLFSTDGAYSQTKTVKDDLEKGDAFVDLRYTDLLPHKDYCLEVDSGREGGPQLAFEDVPFSELAGLSWQLPPDDAGEEGDGDLRVRLAIDPNDAKSFDDRFTLKSTNGAYSQTKTIKDDLERGDRVVDLRFTGMPRDLDYSLEVDLGKEGAPQLAFENVPYRELAGLSWQLLPPESESDQPPTGDLRVRIAMNPDEARSKDDRFILTSDDGAFRQVKSVKDDLEKGDDSLDLLFTGLPRNKAFQLEHDPGKEGRPVVVFADVPYDQLAQLSWDPGPPEERPLPTGPQKLQLRLDTWALEAKQAEDKFTLRADDGSWTQTRTVKDDLVDQDQWVDLEFTGLDAAKSYTLEVDPGDGSPYPLFEGVPFVELAGVSWGVAPVGVSHD
jgi:hypothetical protein